MEKEFVPYELALRLKELGFDEECMAFYNGKYLDWMIWDNDGIDCPTINPYKDIGMCVKTPLWQQAFDWFREEKELLNHSTTHLQDIGEDGSLVESYGYRIMYNKDGYKCDVWEKLARFDTYEEARLACLEKLIEIVENNKQ